MEDSFLYELYDETRKFEQWEEQDIYDSLNEAESSFFQTIDKAKQQGITPIDNGGERDVFSGGGLAGQGKVIKIARTGLEQNRRAVEAWQNIPEGAKQHVAPIHEWGEGYEWIIQSRADGRGDIEEVREALAEHGLYVPDLNGRNIGKYEGKSVLIDLGGLY